MQNELTLYYFDGDTTIGSTLYKKIYYEGNFTSSSSGSSNSTNFPKTYYGAMRQDTFAKKVYFFGLDSPSEELLYDFDLNVGDTMKFLCPSSPTNALCTTVILVDSIGWILIDNNLRHQYFYHADTPDPVVGSLIEGIGNVYGFIYSNVTPSTSFAQAHRNILCVTVNGIQIYGDSPICFSPGHFNAIMTLPDQSISVNEFQNGDEVIFRLANPYNKIIHLTITDLLGRMEGSFQLDHSQDLSLSRSQFYSGYHLAIFTTGDGAILPIKFAVF